MIKEKHAVIFEVFSFFAIVGSGVYFALFSDHPDKLIFLLTSCLALLAHYFLSSKLKSILFKDLYEKAKDWADTQRAMYNKGFPHTRFLMFSVRKFSIDFHNGYYVIKVDSQGNVIQTGYNDKI